MKKILSFIAALVLTLTCGVLLAACGGGGNDRKGERCYINYVYNNDYQLIVRAETKYKNNDWFGVEDQADGTQKQYFIKGDTVTFKVYCQSYEFYLDNDFKLVVNGQPINMTAKTGALFTDEPDVVYYEGSCQINKTSTIDVLNIKEKKVNVTLTAESIDDIFDRLTQHLDAQDLPTDKEEFVGANYFIDNSITVKFAEPNIFGLEKAEWGLRELNDYLVENSAVGEVKVYSGTDIYFYSEGYNSICPLGFIEDMQGEQQATGTVTLRTCYIDEQNNFYGYKTTIQPQMLGVNNFVDGTLKLNLDKSQGQLGIEILGSFEEENSTWVNPDWEEGNGEPLVNPYYIKDDRIRDVNKNNAIFGISFAGKQLGEPLEIGDFGADGKVDVKIKLKKYDSANWKSLYDTMRIKIVDTIINYTISQNGEISLKLDKPYKYFNASAHDDDDWFLERYGIDGMYMYSYVFRFDIIKNAFKSNLVVAKNIAGISDKPQYDYGNLYGQGMSLGNDLKFYVGNGWYNNSGMNSSLPNGFDNNYVGTFTGALDIYDAPLNLYVAEDDFVGVVYNQQTNFYKVEILADVNTNYSVNIVSFNSNYDSPEAQLAALNYEDGKDIVVVRVSEGNSIYSYYVKMRVLPNIRYVTFR